ncbi:MAG: PEP-CTERM sorting domain-containing protein, partial [Burkholderiaceae bacterium]|nr:PEP-CTERM sorting domain-containing protein [Burkholderiaceae bacterium]
YTGSGNAVPFDAGTGAGGWVGAIDQVPDPGVSDPLSLVSFVVFTYNAAAGSLSGTFEFTRSADLGSTLFGVLTGSTTDPDIFGLGGQWSLDYDIQGGSGQFAGASGLGLAFLQFDPLATPDNYTESGLLVFNLPDPLLVPEPASLSLVALGLLGALVLRRRLAPAP